MGKTLFLKTNTYVSLGPKSLGTIKIKLFEDLPYIPVTISSIVPSSYESCHWMKF